MQDRQFLTILLVFIHFNIWAFLLCCYLYYSVILARKLFHFAGVGIIYPPIGGKGTQKIWN